MITKEFRKACVEILEILKYVPKEEYEKIPEDLILFFEEEKDEDYVFGVDTSKALIDQQMLEKTRDILTLLCRDYWSTKEEKEEIEDVSEFNDMHRKYEEENTNEKVVEEKSLEEAEIDLSYLEADKLKKDVENTEIKVQRRTRKRASDSDKKTTNKSTRKTKKVENAEPRNTRTRRGQLVKYKKKKKNLILRLYTGIKAIFFRSKGKH